MGDGMAAAFASARNALAAAVAAQQGLAEETWPELLGRVTARMGLHTGEGTLVESEPTLFDLTGGVFLPWPSSSSCCITQRSPPGVTVRLLQRRLEAAPPLKKTAAAAP
jgi:hypothetical protein